MPDDEARQHVSLARSDSLDPYANLALEHQLARAARPNETIVYLWRNDRTVVIGRNQNAWRECRVEAFERANGHVARRLSGGGAVYHDTGNLNVSFIGRKESFDKRAPVESLVAAVRSFGLDASSTGRNDVTVNGSKVSGCASWDHEGALCMHATLMSNVDAAELGRWLTPDPRKLSAHAVDSVRSRVANLAELTPRATIAALEQAVEQAVSSVYGCEPAPFDTSRLDAAALAADTERFASREWRLGAGRAFTHRADARFAWGGLEIELEVKRGMVKHASVHTDAMDEGFAPALEIALVHCPYDTDTLASVARRAFEGDPSRELLAHDAAALLSGGLSATA